MRSLKEWFVLIDWQQKGPYSLKDLQSNIAITPDTLVWKSGFTQWTAARNVAELDFLFKDQSSSSTPLHEDRQEQAPISTSLDQETLTLQPDPYQFYLWLLILLIVLVYTFYQLKNF